MSFDLDHDIYFLNVYALNRILLQIFKKSRITLKKKKLHGFIS